MLPALDFAIGGLLRSNTHCGGGSGIAEMGAIMKKCDVLCNGVVLNVE
jgi:hypothetical protein